jgi:hypothetical protein
MVATVSVLLTLAIGTAYYIADLRGQVSRLTAGSNAAAESVPRAAAADSAPTRSDQKLAAAEARIAELDAAVAFITADREQLRETLQGEAEERHELQRSELMGVAEAVSALEQRVQQLGDGVDRLIRRRKGAPSKAEVPVAKEAGAWAVVLRSMSSEVEADQMRIKFAGQGVTAEVQAAQVKGRTWYRLRVTGFQGLKDAMAYVEQAKSTLGLTDTWVVRD